MANSRLPPDSTRRRVNETPAAGRPSSFASLHRAVGPMLDRHLPWMVVVGLAIGLLPLMRHAEVGVVFRQTQSVLIGVLWRGLLLAGFLTWALSKTPSRAR